MSSLQGKLTAANLVIKNRRAHFEYVLLNKYLAGVVLSGTEVKSIRMGNVSLQEAYCYFVKGELWVKGMYIATYAQGNLDNHVEHRDRKLLMNKKELSKLLRSKEKGLTIVPLQLFMNERGWAKLQVALAKGRKLYDKRQQIKERDLERAERRDQL